MPEAVGGPTVKAEDVCPLCAGPNRCGINEQGPCWCAAVVIPRHVLAEIPADKRNRVCICPTCATRRP